jgi:hypothetical protein
MKGVILQLEQNETLGKAAELIGANLDIEVVPVNARIDAHIPFSNATIDQVLMFGRNVMAPYEKVLGVIYGDGNRHHADLGLGCEMARRAGRDRPLHILFSDQHTDDYGEAGFKDSMNCGHFVPDLYRLTDASGMTFAAIEERMKSSVSNYNRKCRSKADYLTNTDVVDGKAAAIAENSAVLSLNDLDCLRTVDMYSDYPSNFCGHLDAVTFATWLAKNVEGHDIAGFSVLGACTYGFSYPPRKDGLLSDRDVSSVMRTPYVYAAVVAALVGQPEKIRGIMASAP